MLKHNPILKGAWNKAKKIKKGSLVRLDMRHKSSKDFMEMFSPYLHDLIKKDSVTEKQIMGLIKLAFKK